MIWIDFGIVCLEQDKMSTPPDVTDVVYEAYKRTEESEPFYNEAYNFHTTDKLTGYWYFVWLPEPLCHEVSFFEIVEKKEPWVNVVPKGFKHVKKSLSYWEESPWLNVVPKWTEHVQKILTFYLEESPVHEIAVLLRIQGESKDIVHTYCKLDEFMNLLKEGKVKWNETYFIRS